MYFNRTRHWISKAGIDLLEKEFLSPQWGTIEPQGPILLAWAAVACRLNQFTQGDELQVPIHAQKAMKCKAVSFLTTMLSEGFSADDVRKEFLGLPFGFFCFLILYLAIAARL